MAPALCPLPEARRSWWGEGLACAPTEPGAGCSELSRPGASQTEKLHPRVTKQSSSSEPSERGGAESSSVNLAPADAEESGDTRTWRPRCAHAQAAAAARSL